MQTAARYDPVQKAEWKALARERARRQEAATALRTTASMCEYAAVQLSNGISRREAREAALDMAGALSGTAEVLVRLTRLRYGERRALARFLVASGMTRKDAARCLGVTETTLRGYLRRRPPRG